MKSGAQRLSEWFASLCDGEWEYSSGIKIQTLDNPGWMATISLEDCPWYFVDDCHDRNADDGFDWEICKWDGEKVLHGSCVIADGLDGLLNKLCDVLEAKKPTL